ncbi:hypothetical protein DDD63_05850 [Actinobaculum sp. 313]|nr:hypothetical protein DDD63_05850 [Actinobaculum sp. 313]
MVLLSLHNHDIPDNDQAYRGYSKDMIPVTAATAIRDITAEVIALSTTQRRCITVGIDGHSGAGKTTFARHLAASLRSSVDALAVAEVEDFIPGWQGLMAGVQNVATELLTPLRRNGWADVRRWDWNAMRWDSHVRIPAVGTCRLFLLVGSGASSAACAPLLDRTVWIECDEAERRRRVDVREGESSESWWSIWRRQENALLAQRDSPRLADWGVDGKP